MKGRAQPDEMEVSHDRCQICAKPTQAASDPARRQNKRGTRFDQANATHRETAGARRCDPARRAATDETKQDMVLDNHPDMVLGCALARGTALAPTAGCHRPGDTPQSA